MLKFDIGKPPRQTHPSVHHQLHPRQLPKRGKDLLQMPLRHIAAQPRNVQLGGLIVLILLVLRRRGSRGGSGRARGRTLPLPTIVLLLLSRTTTTSRRPRAWAGRRRRVVLALLAKLLLCRPLGVFHLVSAARGRRPRATRRRRPCGRGRRRLRGFRTGSGASHALSVCLCVGCGLGAGCVSGCVVVKGEHDDAKKKKEASNFTTPGWPASHRHTHTHGPPTQPVQVQGCGRRAARGCAPVFALVIFSFLNQPLIIIRLPSPSHPTGLDYPTKPCRPRLCPPRPYATKG